MSVVDKDKIIMCTKSLRGYMLADNGVAAIEFAFILPFMVLMFFGLLDITDAVSYNRRVTAAASAVGDLVAQNRTFVTKTAIDDYFKAATLIMKPKLDTNLRVVVYGFRKTGNTITQVWKVDNGKGVACAGTPTTTTVPTEMMGYDADPIKDATTPRNDLIVSQACTVYKPMVASFLGKYIMGSGSFKMEQTIMSRPRSSLTLNCFLTTSGGTACPAS
jgi:Flp pilus assembly protein TadG